MGITRYDYPFGTVISQTGDNSKKALANKKLHVSRFNHPNNGIILSAEETMFPGWSVPQLPDTLLLISNFPCGITSLRSCHLEN